MGRHHRKDIGNVLVVRSMALQIVGTPHFCADYIEGMQGRKPPKLYYGEAHKHDELITSGAVRPVMVGKRRLICGDSLLELLGIQPGGSAC